MLISIITPSLNYGRFIAECLDSVASQTGVTVEHLVVDGGSTDETLSIVRQYPQVTWRQEPDRGMSHAINKGFESARGDWVMWLNADDRLKPGALGMLAGRLAASQADVVYGDVDFIDVDGRYLRHLRVPGWSLFVHVHHCCYVQSTAAFYRRSTVLNEGFRLREDFHFVMDGEFYARLARNGKRFEHARLAVADFRLHGFNASKRHLAKSRVMEDILAAERQHVESRAIRRCYGFTPFADPYLNGLSDGLLWIVAKFWKAFLRLAG